MAFPFERWTIYRNLDLTTTGILIRSAATVLKGFIITNAAASARFVKLYNVSVAPVIGTDTPAITIRVPAATVVSDADLGVWFSAGLGIGGTTGVADTDTTAPTTNDLIVNIFYG